MVNPNKKVKRPNGLGNVYNYRSDDEGNIFTLPILDLIKENYIYLYRAVMEEDYYIAPNDSCFFYKDVVYDNEVVGFTTFKNTAINKDALVMQYFYVLPEYRDKIFLTEEIDEASVLFESSIFIEYPTRDMAESLIKHRLARVFEDRYLISRIPFLVPMFSLDEVLKGIVREEYDTTDLKCYNKMSLVYDLDLCAVVGLASTDVDNDFDQDNVDEEQINNYNNISLALREDNEKYNCIQRRAEDPSLKDGTYFKKVRKVMDDNEEVIQNWLSLI
ncbi:MAG: hypothetical protein BZ135_00680 [Methanosphaera sp. rholeuAM6]|nr:MAG: hypothetical protein BZ135_00680 [Methanosphaera sp. rholeuAM6]